MRIDNRCKCLRVPTRVGLICVGIVLFVTISTAQQDGLHKLPTYEPSIGVSGVIRNFGSRLSGLVKLWEEGFPAVQPGVRFEDNLASSDAAIGGLEAGVEQGEYLPLTAEALRTERAKLD